MLDKYHNKIITKSASVNVESQSGGQISVSLLLPSLIFHLLNCILQLKVRKTLTLTTLYSVILELLWNMFISHVPCCSLPCLQYMIQLIKSTRQWKVLSWLWSQVGWCKCLCGHHPCPPVVFRRSSVMAHMVAQLQLNHKGDVHSILPPTLSPRGIHPPTYSLLYGIPPGISRHDTSRADLSLRKVQEVMDIHWVQGAELST